MAGGFIDRHRVGVAVGSVTLAAVVVGGVIAVNSTEVVPTQTQESVDNYRNASHDREVSFYRQACPVFDSVTDVYEIFGEANEDSVGQDPEPRLHSLLSAVDEVSRVVNDQITDLGRIEAPSDVRLLDKAGSVDYGQGRDHAVVQLKDSVAHMEQVAAGIDVDSIVSSEDPATQVNDVAGDLSDAVQSVAAGSGEALSGLFETAPLPQSDKAFNAVKDYPSCADMLTSPVDADTVHTPTVEIWKATVAAHDDFRGAVELFSDQEALSQITTADELVASYREVADVLTRSADTFSELARRHGDDPVTGDSEAISAGVDGFSGMAQQMRSVVDKVANSGADEASVSEASEVLGQVMARQASTEMKIRRLAAPVNEPTSDAVRALTEADD